jgi:hypothetical protein
MDHMNKIPLAEKEPQTQLSSREIAKKPDIYLKPIRSLSSKEKFNEEFRNEYNYAMEYVQFIAENYEVIGETVEPWTKPFAGMPAEQWAVPCNKPVWGPRHLAAQLSRCNYHRLKMIDGAIGPEQNGMQQMGQIIVDSTVERVTAKPVVANRSVFMGSRAF